MQAETRTTGIAPITLQVIIPGHKKTAENDAETTTDVEEACRNCLKELESLFSLTNAKAVSITMRLIGNLIALILNRLSQSDEENSEDLEETPLTAQECYNAISAWLGEPNRTQGTIEPILDRASILIVSEKAKQDAAMNSQQDTIS
ncbi:MAG: hypothetical protein WC846_01205 [Candidatus Gracilibacteria bacterium]